MRSLYFLPAVLITACQPASESEGTARGDDNDLDAAAEAPRIAPTPDSIDAQANVVQANSAAARVVPEEIWLGRFAATTELCRGGAWDIGETRIVTDRGTSCDIDRVGRAAQQVTLRMSCSADGTRSHERWVLTPGGAQRMKVRREKGGEQAEVDLIRCS